MFRNSVMSVALGLVVITSSYALQTAPPAASLAEPLSAAKESSLSMTVLSAMTDEQSTTFRDHVLQGVSTATYKAWRSRIPAEVRPPISKRGRVAIEFVLHANGTVSDLLLANPSGDVVLDRAAWGAMTSAKYEPFPANFNVREVKLLLSFGYNEEIH